MDSEKTEYRTKNKQDSASADTSGGKKGKRLMLRVSAAVLIAAALAAALFGYEIRRYEKGILDVCAEQQDSYVRLVIDQIGLKSNRTDASIIRDIIGTLDASDGRYWTFSRGEDILFVKNVLETNRYKGLNARSYFGGKSASAFVRSLGTDQVRHGVITLRGKRYVASGEAFTYRGKTYRLVLLTSPSVILENNDYLSARTAVITIFALLLILFVLSAMILAWRYQKLEKQKLKGEKEISRLNRSVAQLGGYVSDQMFRENRLEAGAAGAGTITANEEEEADMLYRKYELKFYLNAEHYIIIDGKRGDLHPHTWEFSLEFGLPRDSFQQFGTVEKRIQNYLERYQNQVLNEIAPFDTIVPTVENLAEYFAKGFREQIEGFDGKLFRVKAAETPTRIYIVDLNDMDEEA